MVTETFKCDHCGKSTNCHYPASWTLCNGTRGFRRYKLCKPCEQKVKDEKDEKDAVDAKRRGGMIKI